MANQQQPTFNEQSKMAALIEMKLHPENVLALDRRLSPSIENNLEALIVELGSIWIAQEQKRNPFYLP